MNLKNKRILITAGPTWVPLDKIRIISNIATGQTGILLAKRLKAIGAKVTLLLGPVESGCLINKKIKVIRFKFFKDLKKLLISELKNNKYNILIHSAAVSDYQPKRVYPYKVKSNFKEWKIKLVPTEKLIDLIKKLAPSSFLIGFKFELNITESLLIKNAKSLLKRIGLNLVIANTISNKDYKAYIVDEEVKGPYFSRVDLAKQLINILKIK
ncbi:MAG: phosphopantothenoylcysteine decarboxylase [Candidatus Omnitrophica bacterium]|nr:phosphopantothenoylcysteine decarboxylase [Candidatus Omnitrophota bacterium]